LPFLKAKIIINCAATLNQQHLNTDLGLIYAKSFSAKLPDLFISKNAYEATLAEQCQCFSAKQCKIVDAFV
jgi:hypothetical protein